MLPWRMPPPRTRTTPRSHPRSMPPRRMPPPRPRTSLCTTPPRRLPPRRMPPPRPRTTQGTPPRRLPPRRMPPPRPMFTPRQQGHIGASQRPTSLKTLSSWRSCSKPCRRLLISPTRSRARATMPRATRQRCQSPRQHRREASWQPLRRSSVFLGRHSSSHSTCSCRPRPLAPSLSLAVASARSCPTSKEKTRRSPNHSRSKAWRKSVHLLVPHGRSAASNS
mmetsp:Transcript_120812/g.385714  ORF Transcript_120812/g.385714 Transcript_120812/m.385714 type:complete len:222 (+) Transcript_120812:1421-2086(+)